MKVKLNKNKAIYTVCIFTKLIEEGAKWRLHCILGYSLLHM